MGSRDRATGRRRRGGRSENRTVHQISSIASLGRNASRWRSRSGTDSLAVIANDGSLETQQVISILIFIPIRRMRSRVFLLFFLLINRLIQRIVKQVLVFLVQSILDSRCRFLSVLPEGSRVELRLTVHGVFP